MNLFHGRSFGLFIVVPTIFYFKIIKVDAVLGILNTLDIALYTYPNMSSHNSKCQIVRDNK